MNKVDQSTETLYSPILPKTSLGQSVYMLITLHMAKTYSCLPIVFHGDHSCILHGEKKEVGKDEKYSQTGYLELKNENSLFYSHKRKPRLSPAAGMETWWEPEPHFGLRNGNYLWRITKWTYRGSLGQGWLTSQRKQHGPLMGRKKYQACLSHH